MRQQFFKPLDGIFGDAAEDIAEPGKRIDPDKFTRSDEAAQDGRGPAAAIASEEGPVVTAHGKAPQRPLGTVVVCVLLRRTVLPGASPGRLPLVPAGST
jgi:hypothetical protein